MIQKFKFTEIFLMAMDFYPRYIYIKKTISDRFRYSDNIGIFQDLFLDDDLLKDKVHGLHFMMMWQINEVAKKQKCNKDIFCMYDIDMNILHNDFKQYIYDDDEDYSYKKDIENSEIIYIDDYTEEFAQNWKNKKRNFNEIEVKNDKNKKSI
jgi:hypothetical protein